MIKEEQKSIKGAWPILFRHMKDYMPSIVMLAVLGIFSAAANGTVPYIVGLFLDALLDLERTITLGGVVVSVWLALLILWVGVQVVANVTDWIIDRRGRVLRTEMQFGYQSKAFSHLLFVPLSFHKDEKIGELGNHISKTGWQIASIADNILISLTPPLLSVIVGFSVTFFIHPLFTLILVIGVVLYGIVLIRLVVPTTHLLEEGHTSWDTAYADAMQAVTNIQSVKHMATEEYESEQIKRRFMDTARGFWTRLQFMWSNINFYQRMIVLATQTTIFFVSIYFIQNDLLTIGELVALNGYAGMLFGPFVMLGYNWQVLQNGLIGIKKSEEKIFNVPYETYSPDGCFTPHDLEGAVSFKNVSFSYTTDEPVLRDLNFSVAPGERVAFVGKSGVGKSTTIDLISAYYFPTEGVVTVDDHDTRTFSLKALRDRIAIVPQEPVLFNDTIMMNIRYGRLDATDEEVFVAARKAHADEFIGELTDGYEQLVGERGVKLSVGQKQRIAIARAILRDPSILILDEPTSALDAHTEQYIAASFEELMKGRTTFIVAHRLSTVRKADRIFVFDKGTIVEEGTHDELIHMSDGVYRKLHEFQTT